ncbi:MAG: hypothetical protein L0154_25225 [Chloroflexi bacterium]|nr:hypothetical protein [Chloroflexota bacterium]
MKTRLLTVLSILLIAVMALPVLTPTAQAQEDDPPVLVDIEGFVQYVGEDYAVIDGYVVYANGAFDPADLTVGDYVVVSAEMNDDGTFTAASLEFAEPEEEPEDPEPGDEIVVVGPITITEDEILVGDYVIAPAGAFNPSGLEDGDIVIIVGTLLNETTIQASSFFLVEEVDEDDDEDEEECDEEEEEDCEEEDDEDDEEDTGACTNLNPVGETLAEAYEVDEEDILGWRCDGYGYGEIARALALADLSGDDADEILARRADGEGWGNILKDYDIHPSELAPGHAISRGKNKHNDEEEEENLRGNGRGNNGNNGRGNGRGNNPND